MQVSQTLYARLIITPIGKHGGYKNPQRPQMNNLFVRYQSSTLDLLASCKSSLGVIVVASFWILVMFKSVTETATLAPSS